MRHFDEKLARLIKNRLNSRVAKTRATNGCANGLGRRGLPESCRNDRSTLEVHPQVERFRAVWMKLVPVKSGAHARQHQDYRDADKKPALTQPVNSYVFE